MSTTKAPTAESTGLSRWFVGGHLFAIFSYSLSFVHIHPPMKCLPFSFKDIGQIRLEPHPLTTFNLDYLFKDPIFTNSHILRYEE